jgi:hypothetical protein
MNRPTRRLASTLTAVCLALALTLSAVAGADAAEGIHYTKEGLQEYEKQLNGGEIQSVTVNRKLRSLRITLKNGSHVLATYPKSNFPAEESKLKAHHVTVTVLSSTAANKELKEKPKHHKIRYIVGGVLIVVIVIVGAVLLLRGRRERD